MSDSNPSQHPIQSLLQAQMIQGIAHQQQQLPQQHQPQLQQQQHHQQQQQLQIQQQHHYSMVNQLGLVPDDRQQGMSNHGEMALLNPHLFAHNQGQIRAIDSEHGAEEADDEFQVA